MTRDSETRKNARAIYRILSKTYPEVRCELDFKNPLQLIVAVVLSAQCTDKRVNAITPALFKKYKKASDYAQAPLKEIEQFIYSAGFYRAKARHLKGLGEKLVEEYGGKVPDSLDELVTLPGVGRKTANVVLGHAFEWVSTVIPGIPNACPKTTLAVLRPTPGRVTNSSSESGTLPPYSSTNFSPSPLRCRALAR